MKILLVFPKIEHGAATYHDQGSWGSILFGYPIITLPHLAAITPSNHQVELINENYENLDFNTDADLIGITCYTMTAPRVYEIADELRKRGKKVVLGGYHPTALPQEAKQHADSVVLGEAELTWPEVIADAEKGQMKEFYGPNTTFDMVTIPPLRRDLIKHNPIMGAVQSSRGCTNRCEFCAIASFCNHGLKQRPVKNVVAEIQQMPNRLFVIHDPHLTANRKYAMELFRELIKQKVNKGWVANGTANILGIVDDEFLKLAHKSGCVEWFVGFESVSQAALNNIKKTHNKVEDFKKTIDRLHKYNMTVQGGIIFGFDEDTPDIFETTLQKMNEWNIDAVEINILTPYPGTPLYDRLVKENRLLTKDWSRYTQVDVVFKPKLMTEQELFNGARMVAKNYYSMYRVIQRAARVFLITRRVTGLLPAGTNYTFRRYYKRDFGF
ncbi:MAG: B12-binding domain-containing radical SAM protein [Candidatus Thermoplasmatota archaeon]|nr:B12-binding domain-containing radical SAM protein [Candidatus Thermoplasmatota archaeon]MBU1940693.1 B12-binding domain-containing radical SAM protein [Candidatus Thermoplasmatota archaeon]